MYQRMTNQFYVRAYHEQMKADYKFPCFLLVQSSWDDFGFKTTFELQYYDERKKSTFIGTVKIMDLQNDNVGGKTILPESFTELLNNFCSLGNSTNYYKSLNNLLQKEESIKLLDALNDAAYMPGVKEKFENSSAIKISLLREGEAKTSLLLDKERGIGGFL